MQKIANKHTTNHTLGSLIILADQKLHAYRDQLIISCKFGYTSIQQYKQRMIDFFLLQHFVLDSIVIFVHIYNLQLFTYPKLNNHTSHHVQLHINGFSDTCVQTQLFKIKFTNKSLDGINSIFWSCTLKFQYWNNSL